MDQWVYTYFLTTYRNRKELCNVQLFQISHSSEVQVGKEFTFFGSASAKNIYKMKTADLKL